jgi:NhaP-type Na+/H+ or K+/H+ antiporter
MEKVLLLTAILIFGYGLFSQAASRSPITAPMVFVTVGILLSPLMLDVFNVKLTAEPVKIITEITLILVLFIDSSTIDIRSLLHHWKIPVRLLFIGLPLTMLLGSISAYVLFPEINLWLILMMTFILSPTDAALGQAVVTSDKVPLKTRESISVESGLNDGIALPPILVCIAAYSATEDTHLEMGYWVTFTLEQLIFGPFMGAVVGWLGGKLVDRASRSGWMNPTFQRLTSASLAIMAYAFAELVHGNGFIAAFFGGLMLGIHTKKVREQIQEFGETESQQMMLIVFLVMGLVMVPFAVNYWDGKAFLYAVLSLTVIRMVPVAISLIGSPLDWAAVGFIAWFGPRGIASVLYLLMVVLEVGVKGLEKPLSIIVLTVLLSVFLHGLTAVPLSKLYGRHAAQSD